MNVTNFKILAAAVLFFVSSGIAMAATVDAIAVDDDADTRAGQAGYGVGEGSSEAAAKSEALKNCRDSGNKSCEVAITYSKCGAYASSKKHSGSGIGDTEAAAKSAALEDCGNDSCKIVISDCAGK